jgi:hypothetical protein
MQHTETAGKAPLTVHFLPDHQGELHCGTCKLYNEQINITVSTQLQQNAYKYIKL